jgi:hypothetical protein
MLVPRHSPNGKTINARWVGRSANCSRMAPATIASAVVVDVIPSGRIGSVVAASVVTIAARNRSRCRSRCFRRAR